MTTIADCNRNKATNRTESVFSSLFLGSSISSSHNAQIICFTFHSLCIFLHGSKSDSEAKMYIWIRKQEQIIFTISDTDI